MNEYTISKEFLDELIMVLKKANNYLNTMPQIDKLRDIQMSRTSESVDDMFTKQVLSLMKEGLTENEAIYFVVNEAYGSRRDDNQDVEIQKQAWHDQFKRDEMEAELGHEDNPGRYKPAPAADTEYPSYTKTAASASGLNSSEENDLKSIVMGYASSMNQYVPKQYQDVVTAYSNGEKVDAEQAKKLIRHMRSMDLI